MATSDSKFGSSGVDDKMGYDGAVRDPMESNEKYDGSGDGSPNGRSAPKMRAIRDSSVKFEEYQHYAKKCRAEEDASALDEPSIGILGRIFPPKNNTGIGLEGVRRNSAIQGMYGDDTETPAKEIGNFSRQGNLVDITSDEWINAQRALRTASGAACFYLITTDILGPFALPYSFGTVGYVPGSILFTIFAILAGYSGYLLHQMFINTDSYQYPTRSYGDVAYRIYGQWARIPINLLQSIQLIFTVAIITISNGLALSVITKFNLCYVVCIVILVVVGMVLGQIRTLQKFGWLANVAVFFNVFIMILTMAVAASTGPYYAPAQSLSAGAALGDGSTAPNPKTGIYPPVQHHIGVPVTGDFVGAVNGIMNCIYAYGGANVFNEFMAEMKRPRDFLHAMWAAQTFIWFVYMFYGLFMYGYQGQYSVNPSPLTVSPYWALVVANLFYILSAGIAACLYGNIGLKVIYNNIGVELLKMPPLTAKAGKILWVILIPIYWAAAFAIGGAIPNFGALVGVVAAICIVQFTYSLPPLLFIGYRIKVNAVLPGEGYDPATGQVVRHDKGLKRIMRGLTGGTMLDKLIMAWNIIYFLGALALAGLGAYASISLIIDAFAADSSNNAFSCKSPVDFAIF